MNSRKASDDPAKTLREQLEYYGGRAREYDDWWLRQGRYDRGTALNTQWFEEASTVRTALNAFQPEGRVLEIACGTGIWTRELLPFASEFTALDGSCEMLEINQAAVHSPRVKYIEANIFEWQPAEEYDSVFFGFWLSHVPPARFEQFWNLVARCLAPGGRVFFVDSRREATSTAVDHHLPELDSIIQRRRLHDGREFDIYKIFYDPPALTKELANLGWDFSLKTTAHYFLYGCGQRSDGAGAVS